MKADIKKQTTNQLNRIEGQIRGLKKMVEEEKYCIDILTQAQAIKSSISSVENKILENHLSTHVVEQIEAGKIDTVIDEVLKIYKQANKNK